MLLQQPALFPQRSSRRQGGRSGVGETGNLHRLGKSPLFTPPLGRQLPTELERDLCDPELQQIPTLTMVHGRAHRVRPPERLEQISNTSLKA
jgi:hypothetical protein